MIESKFRTLTGGFMSPLDQEEMITALRDLETDAYARFLVLLRKRYTLAHDQPTCFSR